MTDEEARRRYAAEMQAPLAEVRQLPIATVRKHLAIIEEQDAAYRDVARMLYGDADEA
ncbi:MAG: hypothetical protein N3D18_13675 [Roseococcus sp.]|nr:hypothetical protein [Roseococcus sp.]